MRPWLTRFWQDDAGAVTLDWVVLTAALVGTGFAVMSTVVTGIEGASLGTTERLRGHVITSSFGSDICRGGVRAVQDREDRRVAAGGADPVVVTAYMSLNLPQMTDEVLLATYSAMSERLDGQSAWTRAHTVMTALECEMVLRGLD